jgi:HEAT repeat protein
MPVTMEQVRAALDPEEPRYEEAAARLGAEAVPHLDQLVTSSDPHIASKAASLAGMIREGAAAAVVEKAAASGDVRVRVAAAGAARHLPGQAASRVLSRLVADRDPGVQKVALKSAPKGATPELRRSIEGLGESAANPGIRELSRETLRRLS